MNTSGPLFSDRENGPLPRTRDTLPEKTVAGLIRLVQSRVSDESIAAEFPERCEEHGYITGTDEQAFAKRVRAVIPDIEWPLGHSATSSDVVVFDVIELMGRYVQQPMERKHEYHRWFKHYPLDFKRAPGRIAFRAEVNQILARGGTVFELDKSLQVRRLGPLEVQLAVGALDADTGDGELDSLISDARRLYKSRRAGDRKRALDTLWDAFERLKSSEVQGSRKKAASTAALLSYIRTDALRGTVEREVRELTRIGNDFRIRHHETDRHEAPVEAFDYLFIRLSATLFLLLKQSGRLTTVRAAQPSKRAARRS